MTKDEGRTLPAIMQILLERLCLVSVVDILWLKLIYIGRPGFWNSNSISDKTKHL